MGDKFLKLWDVLVDKCAESHKRALSRLPNECPYSFMCVRYHYESCDVATRMIVKRWIKGLPNDTVGGRPWTQDDHDVRAQVMAHLTAFGRDVAACKGLDVECQAYASREVLTATECDAYVTLWVELIRSHPMIESTFGFVMARNVAQFNACRITCHPTPTSAAPHA
jgi:hypothetical protein